MGSIGPPGQPAMARRNALTGRRGIRIAEEYEGAKLGYDRRNALTGRRGIRMYYSYHQINAYALS